MARGLMWLPLLVVFFGLAWAGWNEYRKLEAYKVWATQFERAKYDIYAVLGQQGNLLTWGLPTRNGMIDTAVLDLTTVETLTLEVDGQPIAPDQLPEKGRFALGFALKAGDVPTEGLCHRTSIPFTDGDIARRWFEFLTKEFSLRSPTEDTVPSR